jgi:hypothetical protein
MNGIETNIFSIRNLGDLNFEFDTYAVRNLKRGQAEYFQNKDHLVRTLSFKLGAPVQVTERNGDPFLAIPSTAGPVPERLSLVRTNVVLEKVRTGDTLNFLVRNAENDAICLRVVQFMLQAPLFNDTRLWQPSAGMPFFEKNAVEDERGIARYRGFAARAVVTPAGGIGLCVDVRTKFVRLAPLPVRLDRMTFRGVKGKVYVYHYGDRWYEIHIEALSDVDASKEIVGTGADALPLIEFIAKHSAKPHAEDLTSLPHDAAVVRYRNNRGEDRAAPAGLCYAVCDNRDVSRTMYERSIIPPFKRREYTHDYVERYLKDLRFKGTTITVSTQPEHIEQKMFRVPDLEFGRGRKLSVRGTSGASQTGLDGLGKKRIDLLRDPAAGFFVKERFRPQYFIVPQSVAESWGEQFLADLTREIDKFYPEGGGYKPDVITYRDRGPKTYREQGKAILEAMQGRTLVSAYGVVMLHNTTDKKDREHDALAAMVIRELRRCDICAAVIHSAVGEQSYARITGADGKSRYQMKSDQRGRLSGYLRNVALNKVLLTNSFWPFVLSTPLHADVTLGIDVKNQTAAFSVIGSKGTSVRALFEVSRQKEKLLKDQVLTYLARILRDEHARMKRPIESVVLHRDGRCYQSEIDGAEAAMEKLKAEGVVAASGTLTVLEIWKTAPVHLRLFDVQRTHGSRVNVENPQVGTYTVVNGNEGFVCSTGRAFFHKGTVQPLHVRCAREGIPFVQALEDVYALTTLAWTRPEDCSRYPVTLKLTDRWLGEEAAEFDAAVLAYETTEDEDEKERASA